MNCYLVTYDIPDDRRRTKVANLLQDYGQRVQFSVFEVWLDDQAHARLDRQLTQVIDEEEDSVRLYRLCEACRKQVEPRGQGQPPQPPGLVII